MNPNEHIADQNVERLLAGAYRPETPDPALAERVVAAMLAEARQRPVASAARPRRNTVAQLAALAVAASLLVGFGLLLGWRTFAGRDGGEVAGRNADDDAVETPPQPARLAAAPAGMTGLTAQARKASVAPPTLAVGQSLETKADERRRAALPDGSILYLNENTSAQLDAERHVTLGRGEVFVEVTPLLDPAPTKFVVATPDRQITALGTKFNVRRSEAGTAVMVTQGKVAVSGLKLPLLAGQQLAAVTADAAEPPVEPAPRASYALDWTRDLMAAALSPLVPDSKYAGGALVAKDPNGQESRLSLRRYHVDVHIEDGFARTTIDQTYFNHETSRLEGTFYFPLPPDASLSRLAMYVNGRLMEGGMAEREYARQVFESIVYRQKDPALLEWIDGSTFKMRVFPLEGRQEKRIVLSYTQKLASLYGRTEYRFPGGHNLPSGDRWSAELRVKKGAELKWTAQPQEYKVTKEDGDLRLDASAEKIKPDRDIVLTLNEEDQPPAAADLARFSSCTQEGAKYLMLRWRPDLPGEKRRERRDWVFLFESSGDRDPLLARAQIDIVKTILENAEHDDTFAVVAAGTHAEAWKPEPRPATPKNVQKALKFLEQTHLVGALDLEGALNAAAPLCKAGKNAHLVHIGSAVPVLGRRDIDVLVKLVPDGTRYVGVGVGKRWQRTLMKSAAARTGGFCTQINPDEQIAWRAFDLLATLNAPRMLNVNVVDAAEQLKFLCHNDALTQGEELCAIARVDKDKPLPAAVEVTGLVDGKLRRERIAVAAVADGAAYLPRTWAKLEIERLVAEGAEKNKPRIIELSKAMYVMSPFTSLLVLEDEQMYVQYKVDRGRKDHWAMYACPVTIPVVHEPLTTPGGNLAAGKKGKPTVEEVLHTLLVRVPPGRGFQRVDLGKNVTVNLTGAAADTWDTAGGPGSIEQFPTYLSIVVDQTRHVAGNGTLMQDGGFYYLPATTLSDGRLALPTFSHVTVPYTVSVPDGGTVLMGGLGGNFAVTNYKATMGSNWPGITNYRGLGATSRASLRYATPSLGNGAIGRDTQSLMMMVTPRIIIQEEEEERLGLPSVNSGYYVRPELLLSEALAFHDRRVEDLVFSGAIDLNLFGDAGEDGAMAAGTLREQRVVTGVIQPPAELQQLVQNQVELKKAVEQVRTEVVNGGPIGTPQIENIEALDVLVLKGHDRDVNRVMRIIGDIERLSAPQMSFYDYSILSTKSYPVADLVLPIKGLGMSGMGGMEHRFDGIPIVYPDADTWRTLTAVRKEHYSNMDLAKRGTAERPIRDALKSPTELELSETPLDEVVNLIKENHKIEVQIDKRALDDVGLAVDTPVTKSLKGMSLRSALRLMLHELDLTYVVQDEVLLITTPEEADHQLGGQAYLLADMLYRAEHAALSQPPAYQTPRFGDDWAAFADLTAYAPGLHTSAADVWAAVEAETEPHPAAKPGQIDKQARRLIETARAAGWQTATIDLVGRVSNSSPPRKPQASSLTPHPSPLNIDFDGTGRFRFERTTAAGLREQVICDGASLWHLYPDLGLAGRRATSRFHRALLGQLIPWALPPAEDLAHGADLVSIDENTVAVVPHGLEHWKDKAGKPLPYVRLHLVFADNRLTERRLVEMPAGKILLRQTYAADGMVRVVGGEEKAAKVSGSTKGDSPISVEQKLVQSPIEWRIALKPCGAPSLTPDATKLVVLPLPVRSRGWLANSRNLAQGGPCENWSQDDALSVIAACLHTYQHEAQEVLAKRFFDRGDRRLGLYVLLAASGFTWDTSREVAVAERPPVRLNPTADHPREAAARYLVGYLKARQAGDGDLGWVRGPRSGLLQQLTEFGLLRGRWKNGKANEASESNRKDTQQRTLDFVANCPMPQFGWTLLTAVLKENKDAAFERQLAEAALKFEDVPALRYAARYERAAGLAQAAALERTGTGPAPDVRSKPSSQAGAEPVPVLSGAAQEAFRTLYTDTLKRGFLPPVDERFRAAFQTGDEGNRQWQTLLRDSAKKLIARHARPAAVRLAWQVRQVGDPSLAEELFTLATANVPEKEELPTVLAAVAYLTQNGQQPRADAMLQPLLEKLLADEDYARWPGLWRFSAAVAERRGQAARSLQCTERAMDLEYESLPEQVNVQTIRTQYGQLLGRYQQVAAALATVGSRPPADFLGRVVRAADRWRALDTDPTAACQAAARIFTDLGAADLAWDYLTTPLAARPNEAAPWVSLAESLRQQSQFELADRAYASAFEAEPTNARILWDRAQILQQIGRAAEAKQLLRQISESEWQPAFSGLKSQAKAAAGY